MYADPKHITLELNPNGHLVDEKLCKAIDEAVEIVNKAIDEMPEMSIMDTNIIKTQVYNFLVFGIEMHLMFKVAFAQVQNRREQLAEEKLISEQEKENG